MMKEESKRNSGIKQPHHGEIVTNIESYNNLGLTKRNSNFLHQLNKILDQRGFSGEKRNQKIEETVQKMLDGQKKGLSAKNLFNTPTEYAEELINGPKNVDNIESAGFWPTMGDTALMFVAIFTLMYGVLGFFAKGKGSQNGQMGIIGIIIIALVFGVGWAWIVPLINPTDKKKKPKLWKTLGYFALLLIVVFAILSGVTLIPKPLNPILPPIWYLIIAGFSFVGDIWLRKNYKITNGIFSAPQQSKK